MTRAPWPDKRAVAGRTPACDPAAPDARTAHASAYANRDARARALDTPTIVHNHQLCIIRSTNNLNRHSTSHWHCSPLVTVPPQLPKSRVCDRTYHTQTHYTRPSQLERRSPCIDTCDLTHDSSSHRHCQRRHPRARTKRGRGVRGRQRLEEWDGVDGGHLGHGLLHDVREHGEHRNPAVPLRHIGGSGGRG